MTWLLDPLFFIKYNYLPHTKYHLHPWHDPVIFLNDQEFQAIGSSRKNVLLIRSLVLL